MDKAVEVEEEVVAIGGENGGNSSITCTNITPGYGGNAGYMPYYSNYTSTTTFTYGNGGGGAGGYYNHNLHVNTNSPGNGSLGVLIIYFQTPS